MSNFTTVAHETISEMKALNLEIKSLNEMEISFGDLTLDETIKRQNAKNRLSLLIDKL